MEIASITKKMYPLYLRLQELVFGLNEWPPVDENIMDKKNYIHFGLLLNQTFLAGISAKINKHNAELILICTLPEFRLKGFASLLLNYLVAELRNKSVDKLFVDSYLESAKSWYLTHGFSENDLLLEMDLR